MGFELEIKTNLGRYSLLIRNYVLHVRVTSFARFAYYLNRLIKSAVSLQWAFWLLGYYLLLTEVTLLKKLMSRRFWALKNTPY